MDNSTKIVRWSGLLHLDLESDFVSGCIWISHLNLVSPASDEMADFGIFFLVYFVLLVRPFGVLSKQGFLSPTLWDCPSNRYWFGFVIRFKSKICESLFWRV